MFNRIVICPFIALFLSFAACGPQGSRLDTQFVQGVVTNDGQPLKGAFVSFVPETEGEGMEPASGYTDDTGNYKLSSVTGNPEKGAVAGHYIVTVSCYEITVKKGKDEMGEEIDVSTQKLIVPEKYTKANTSPLKATVVKGENQLDFDITK